MVTIEEKEFAERVQAKLAQRPRTLTEIEAELPSEKPISKKIKTTRFGEFVKKTRVLRKPISKRILKKKIGGTIGAKLRKFATRKPIKRKLKPIRPISPEQFTGAMNPREARRLAQIQNEAQYQKTRINRMSQKRINWSRRLNENRELERARIKLDREKFNLMKAHTQMDRRPMDFLDETGNILQAENIFATQKSQNILRTDRPSILETRKGGNQLNFFS